MPKITYYNGSTDAYSGQVNMEAAIYVDGQIVGAAEYVLYDGELTISDIQIRPEWRRKGMGSRLMKYIKQENPDYKYVPSLKTELGSEFVHKDLPLDEKHIAKFVYESLDFERGKDPKRAMGLGRSVYCKELYNSFIKDLRKAFPDLSTTFLKEDEIEGFYIELPLDPYTEEGMNLLDRITRKVIREKYKDKLVFVTENFLEKYYKGEFPDESPFYGEEDLMIKIL